MTRTSKRVASAVVAALMLLGLSACTGKATEQYKDAARGTTNSAPADIITMPDGWSNVAAKCDGTSRVYVIFHGDENYGSLAVVPNDPRCK